MDQLEIDNLSPEETGKIFPIVLSKPTSKWKQLFEEEKSILMSILGDYAISFEHIGSTAIPGILAKPIIDILLEIPNKKKVKDKIVRTMKARGYYFVLRTDRQISYLMFIKGISIKGVIGQTYHIHMAEKGHTIWDKVYFRDYLIEKPELALEYERLKRKLARKYKHDREKYTEGKTAFVMKITKEAKENL